jgi:hypothetical protein
MAQRFRLVPAVRWIVLVLEAANWRMLKDRLLSRTKTHSSVLVLPRAILADARYVGDACRLNLDHAVCDQLDKFGHQGIYNLSGFEELNSYWKVFATAARRSLRMNAMVRSESRMPAQHCCPGNPFGKKEGDVST